MATLSVFAYCFFSLFGAQYLVPHNQAQDNTTLPYLEIEFSNTEPYKEHTPYMIFPYFTILEFISYMGWIKVQPLDKGNAVTLANKITELNMDKSE